MVLPVRSFHARVKDVPISTPRRPVRESKAEAAAAISLTRRRGSVRKERLWATLRRTIPKMEWVVINKDYYASLLSLPFSLFFFFFFVPPSPSSSLSFRFFNFRFSSTVASASSTGATNASARSACRFLATFACYINLTGEGPINRRKDNRVALLRAFCFRCAASRASFSRGLRKYSPDSSC